MQPTQNDNKCNKILTHHNALCVFQKVELRHLFLFWCFAIHLVPQRDDIQQLPTIFATYQGNLLCQLHVHFDFL